jgi:hypothetical protein
MPVLTVVSCTLIYHSVGITEKKRKIQYKMESDYQHIRRISAWLEAEGAVLIDLERIRSIARQKKIGVAVAEKDYSITWLLSGFYHPESALRSSFLPKGGTSLRKAYFPGIWHFSEDLDFTVIDDMGAGKPDSAADIKIKQETILLRWISASHIDR